MCVFSGARVWLSLVLCLSLHPSLPSLDNHLHREIIIDGWDNTTDELRETMREEMVKIFHLMVVFTRTLHPLTFKKMKR